MISYFLISNYTLIDALKYNIVLPFKHYVLNPIYENKKQILTTEFLNCIYEKLKKYATIIECMNLHDEQKTKIMSVNKILRYYDTNDISKELLDKFVSYI